MSDTELRQLVDELSLENKALRAANRTAYQLIILGAIYNVGLLLVAVLYFINKHYGLF